MNEGLDWKHKYQEWQAWNFQKEGVVNAEDQESTDISLPMNMAVNRRQRNHAFRTQSGCLQPGILHTEKRLREWNPWIPVFKSYLQAAFLKK